MLLGDLERHSSWSTADHMSNPFREAGVGRSIITPFLTYKIKSNWMVESRPGYDTAPCQDSKGQGCAQNKNSARSLSAAQQEQLLSYQCVTAQVQYCTQRGLAFAKIPNRQEAHFEAKGDKHVVWSSDGNEANGKVSISLGKSH